MTEESENNHPKQPKCSDQLKNYPLGKGDYFQGIPTSKGMHYWGYVAGMRYEMECKDLKEFENKVADLIAQSKIIHMAQAVREEEISLRFKENGLEKTSKDLGGDKK